MTFLFYSVIYGILSGQISSNPKFSWVDPVFKEFVPFAVFYGHILQFIEAVHNTPVALEIGHLPWRLLFVCLFYPAFQTKTKSCKTKKRELSLSWGSWGLEKTGHKKRGRDRKREKSTPDLTFCNQRNKLK